MQLTTLAKGKVESGVKYVKNNALKARSFANLEEQQRFLEHWEATVADTRIHGTTKRQVGKVFMEIERAALAPLPIERFPCFQEAQRIVARDGHVEVAKAYYSVPPEYLGRKVWARWDARLTAQMPPFRPPAPNARKAAQRHLPRRPTLAKNNRFNEDSVPTTPAAQFRPAMAAYQLPDDTEARQKHAGARTGSVIALHSAPKHGSWC